MTLTRSRLLLAVVLFAASPRAAEAQPPTGFELAFHGPDTVLSGRDAAFRGVAFRVRGLAELEPLASARVSARYATDAGKDGPWQRVRADGRGFFELRVPMPARPAGTSHLEVRVGDGRAHRTFEFPLAFERPWLLDLFTDRRLYEPGEKIHAWARLRDRRSRAPIAGKRVELTLTATGVSGRAVETGAGGVAATSAVVPAGAREGSYELIARIDGHEVRRTYRVGTRAYARLLAKVEVTPETAQPAQPISVTVTVTTPSGAVVRGAEVTVKLDQVSAKGRTGKDGRAVVAMKAPAYMTHPSGVIPIQVAVVHPAHGAAKASGWLHLKVPRSVQVEAVAAHAALVPETRSLLYVRVSEGAARPPRVGTEVEVTGAAVRNGRQRGRTDAHGLVAIPTFLPPGAANDRGTTITVHVEGAATAKTRIRIPVARHAEVLPTISRPVVAPGDALEVAIARRPSARRRPVVVELLAGGELVSSRVVPPGARRVAIKAPAVRIGVVLVRARALHERQVVEGTGGVDAFLIRPPAPSYATLAADKKRYEVNSTAHLTLSTNPRAAKSWVAVLARDLAAHGGERPFARSFLGGAFDRAVTDPNTKASDAFLRTALAAHIEQDVEPVRAPRLTGPLGKANPSRSGIGSSAQRSVLRDPFPLADELRRRGVAASMRDIEALVATAVSEGRLSDVMVEAARGHRFKPGIVKELEGRRVTLGGGELTVSMIQAVDPSFTYDHVARRIARRRLVKLLVTLAAYLDPGDNASLDELAAAREPHTRWLSRMVERGLIDANDLVDPWGGRFALRKSRTPRFPIAVEAADLELVSPGPDGRLGTRDDVADPFARAVARGTPYAVASGEDELMAQLALLAPGADALRRLQEAYDRVSAEILEAERGDAVAGSVGGVLGGVLGGVGAGGAGSGYGTGAGRGGLRGRRARVPKVRVGAAHASGISSFARVVREKFPPTLFFAYQRPVDPSGKTVIPIPLSEAVTTYRVEAIVWSVDGWTSSTRLDIRVDKGTVIDAPVPRYATVGDELVLPVRVGNRMAKERRLEVYVFAPGEAHEVLAKKSVVVPARDGVLVPVLVPLAHAVDGHMTVGVSSASGAPLDAVKRPITVRDPERRVRREADMLAGDRGELELVVEGQASGRHGAIRVQSGAGTLFGADLGGHREWVESFSGPSEVSASVMAKLRDSDAAPLAEAISAVWADAAVSDDDVSRALKRLTVALDSEGEASSSNAERGSGLDRRAGALLFLAPAARHLGRRSELAADLTAILRGLRTTVGTEVASTSAGPYLLAKVAAALALSRPPGGRLHRVRELVRRVRRELVVVGDYTWVASTRGGHEASAYLALAELEMGEKARALALLRTLVRLAVRGHDLDPLTRTLAGVALARRKLAAPSGRLSLSVDGARRRVRLEGGTGRLRVPALSRPGRHEIRFSGRAPTIYHLIASVEYGLPWSVVPERPGSLAVSIAGKTGRRDERSRLELVVKNRSPRTLYKPIVEVSVPAGAELESEARDRMARRTASLPDASRGTLRIELTPLPPGAVRHIPLPWRWTTGGTLTGLGVAGYPADRPDDLTVLAPRRLEIAAPEGTP